MSNPTIGHPGYYGNDVDRRLRRWTRFAHNVLRVASTEKATRLLAYARDVEPTEHEGTQAFDAFQPDTVLRPHPAYTGRLPRLRRTDTTPLPVGCGDTLAHALLQATQEAYPWAEALADHIKNAQPELEDLSHPAERSSLAAGILIRHPKTDENVARVYTTNTKLRHQVIAAIDEVLGRPDSIIPSTELDFL